MKMPLPLNRILPVAFCALAMAARAQNNPESPTSDSNQIQVLPAPGPVTIDGDDRDWDLSAGIWSYNDPTLVDKYSVWTHLMWDDKGIYLLARYHDLSPLKNATRGKDFMLSWKADAMQTRVIMDNKTPEEHLLHINLFNSSSEDKPYLIVKHGGFKGKPPYDATGPDRPDQLEKYGTTMDGFGGKIAFKPWADGKGYNMEVFWPWSYLRTNGQPLKAGDSFVFGLEAMWGNSDGTALSHRLVDSIKDDSVNRIFFFRARDGWGKAILSDKGNLTVTDEQRKLQETRLKNFVNYDTEGPVPIAYDLPGDRDVTIAIDNKDGKRVRNLIGQFPRKQGANTDFWDGLDDEGRAVPPGEYTVTVVDHEPVRLKFVNSVYNAATPPWPTDTGKLCWGSNHGNPITVATRDNEILVGFTGTEGSSGLLSVTGDGRIEWNDPYELLDVTLDDQYAYAFSRDSWISRVVMRRYDLKTGKLALFEDADKSPNAFLPLKNEQVSDGTIAISGGKVFVFVKGDKLYRLDPKTGEIELEKGVPGLLALDDRGGVLRGLFVDGGIAELSPEGQKTKTLFTAKNLKAPARFAVGPDGRVAISDTGTNQVFVYDAGGKLITTLGSPYAAENNQRPAGKFVETDLIRPWGLDFDSEGRLWVAEAAGTCRRITNWTPDGKLANQFWGAADYGALSGFPILNDSTRFIAHGVEFKLDPQPDILNRPTQEKPLFFHPALGKTRGVVYHYKGNDYAVSVPGVNKQDYVVIARRDPEGVFQPVVRIQYGDKKKPGSVWTDLNGNGKVDEGETVEGFTGARHYWSNGWMRPDLTFITPDQQVFRLKELTGQGVPVYDFANPEKLPNRFNPDFASNRSGTIAMDNAGNISDGIRYATVDGRTGAYPNPFGRHDAPAARRGLLIAPFRTNGVVENVPGVGSITALGGDRGEWFLLSMDGLYLSSILQDSKGDVTLNDNFVGQESFGGFIWRDESGRILVQLGGNSYRIMEVTGLETTRRNVQKISLTPKQIEEGQKLAQARLDTLPVEPKKLEIARVASLPKDAPAPDTKDTLITGVPTIKVQEQGDRSRWFRTALAHDGTDLLIAWQVNDTNPWRNAEGRFTHAFIGGDAVDLQLNVPGRGEIRLLGAPVSGKNTAIYWQKKAKEKENPTTYVVENNEANAQNFDVVKRLESAKVSVNPGLSTYTALIRVPLADLGIDPDKAGELKGVVGVIFSDPSGANRASRLYWHDKATGLVSDVPSEARLNPKNWGPISVGK